MRFVWDPITNDRNLIERHIDFAFASLIFGGATLERLDDLRDYGEARVIAIGLADGIALTVVYTDRRTGDDVIRRIISARVSNRHEREAYVRLVGSTS